MNWNDIGIYGNNSVYCLLDRKGINKMKREMYDKQLIKWARNHYWDSLEKDKDLILRHLRTFAGNKPFLSNKATEADH